ncbi:hypothetical protein PV325_004231 [Microctonus aethiopoides]|uniref:Uncharacterized protein n=1 Tax=Microctonus aethiopoides TaxID=144406 RepID=A0AA39FNT4_9HYME|nr:hypothetical protein PV325_004231 [Microctonus aethiopoides]KAK0173054.1 hypothetical protein PV328_006308 [Microctonus aethiopoides]
MDPIECKKLLETINSKSSNNDKINNKDHDTIIGMTQIDCRLNLKEWNLQYEGEKNVQSRQVMSEALRNLGRPDLVNYIERDKRLFDKSSDFYKYKIHPTINKRHLRVKNTSKRSIFLSKTKFKKRIKTEPNIGHITSREHELDTTGHHEAIEIPHSMGHSILMNGIDDKMAQLLLERRKESVEENSSEDKEIFSKRWMAFIIFLLFIIMTMFIIAMITICKNRGSYRNKYSRQTIINKECDDNCPLMNYSSMAPDIDQRWTTSSMDSEIIKSHVQTSVSELNWPNVIQMYEEKVKNPQNSKIIMADKQEQTHEVMDTPKLKVNKSELKKPKKRKCQSYNIRSDKILDDISMRERIYNSFRKNKGNCRCRRCRKYHKGKQKETYTDDEDDGKNKTITLTESSSSPQKVDTEVEETPRKDEKIHEQIHEEKKNLPRKIEIMTSRSPRLSFPMACTNNDYDTGSLLVKCDDTGGKRSF